MPRGQEERAREFYESVLGLRWVPKPDNLAARGGCWFEAAGAKVHLGVDDDFRPARRAHPGLLVDDLEVDQTSVEGMLPLAVQHGGAGLRLGWDSGFPVSSRYAPPAPFSGTVHGVRVDTAGSTAPGPADQVRTALHAD